MPYTVNKLILVGYVGRNPTVAVSKRRSRIAGALVERHVKVATFSLATMTQLPDGEERTQWHQIKLTDALAEYAEKQVSKGDRLYVEGRLEYGAVEKSGLTIPTAEVHVRVLVKMNDSLSSL